jgi:hypothetical protein
MSTVVNAVVCANGIKSESIIVALNDLAHKKVRYGRQTEKLF